MRFYFLRHRCSPLHLTLFDMPATVTVILISMIVSSMWNVTIRNNTKMITKKGHRQQQQVQLPSWMEQH